MYRRATTADRVASFGSVIRWSTMVFCQTTCSANGARAAGVCHGWRMVVSHGGVTMTSFIARLFTLQRRHNGQGIGFRRNIQPAWLDATGEVPARADNSASCVIADPVVGEMIPSREPTNGESTSGQYLVRWERYPKLRARR